MKQRFKLFASIDLERLETDMNTWADGLPPGTRIRRTQLATGYAVIRTQQVAGHAVIALVNYEIEELRAGGAG